MDLNLLVALDALLDEGSVAGAARRLNLSAPAMSRTLGRIRDALGDPVLVRAGRRLAPTPRALALRGQVRQVVEDAATLLRPEGRVDPAGLDRSFVVRASDYVAGVFGAQICSAVQAGAPRVSLRFSPQGDEDVGALRDGRVDLEIGVIRETGPEIRVQALFQDRFVGVVRQGHALAEGEITAERFAASLHVAASRRGIARGPIDEELAEQGLSRRVALVVPDFYAALFVAAGSDMVAALPRRIALGAARLGLAIHQFELRTSARMVPIAQAWHPRNDSNSGHRWLRRTIRAAIVGLDASPPNVFSS